MMVRCIWTKFYEGFHSRMCVFLYIDAFIFMYTLALEVHYIPYYSKPESDVNPSMRKLIWVTFSWFSSSTSIYRTDAAKHPYI